LQESQGGDDEQKGFEVIRIIDRDVFEGKLSDEHEVVMHDLGHGHREASIIRSVHWEHIATMSDAAYGAYLEESERCRNDPVIAAEREAAHLQRAARRAKTKVRRICKTMGVDALLTLTYRENMQDLEACKKHLKEFVRRVRKLVPGFAYVAAFERQKRGAWHVHMGIHALPFNLPWQGVKVKSYSVIRAVWRSVVGDLGGNIDQARKKRQSRKSPAQMASYISKYILKAFEEGAQYSNRYSSSSYTLPEAVRMRFQAASLADLIALVYAELGTDGTTTNPWLSQFGDRFFLTAEPGPAAIKQKSGQ
jgi:hypothetical protein